MSRTLWNLCDNFVQDKWAHTHTHGTGYRTVTPSLTPVKQQAKKDARFSPLFCVFFSKISWVKRHALQSPGGKGSRQRGGGEGRPLRRLRRVATAIPHCPQSGCPLKTNELTCSWSRCSTATHREERGRREGELPWGVNFSTWSLSVMLHKSHLGFIYSRNVPVQIASL